MNTISLITPNDWHDYKLLDSGDGERLEQFGKFLLRRPDPQILWAKSLPESEWQKADAMFERTYEDKGNWRTFTQIPEEWPVQWQDLTFMAKLAPFKHTGIFPEQAAHWGWFRKLLEEKNGTQPHILNLFAYTGGASIVAAKTGAKVTHVDASRSAIGWAKKNQVASGLDERSIRWILDDAITFVQREVKRGVRYDGIIMDPPVYGHGPNGERWDFKKSFPELLELCTQVLVDKPIFMLINAYAVSTSAITLGNLLDQMMHEKKGTVSIGELALTPGQSYPHQVEALPATAEGAEPARLLSTGIWARWQ